jgi:hydrogenase maturation protease
MDQAPALDQWTELLRDTLCGLRRERRRPLRLAIVGLGDRDRGDDGAGCCVLGELEALRCDRLLLHDGRDSLAEVATALRGFVPDLVLLIDAGRFGVPSGHVRWLTWDQVTEGDASGRQDALLAPLAGYVRTTLGCPVIILGIQCRQSVIPDYMTPTVARAAFHAGAMLNELLPHFIYV